MKFIIYVCVCALSLMLVSCNSVDPVSSSIDDSLNVIVDVDDASDNPILELVEDTPIVTDTTGTAFCEEIG